MNFVFNIIWQTALISVIGFVLLKIFAKSSAPKRSLLASSVFFALIILPLLTWLFMFLNINSLKYEGFSEPIFYYSENKRQGKNISRFC
jgi:energy-coupling factor transporter transmembrane protein EcfT